MTLSIIGAGVGRTGTLSLKAALEQLGFGPCYHMVEVFKDPEAPGRWIDAAEGRPDWERIFQGFNSTVDWPGAAFWREMAEHYPEAKVILTVRDPESWFASTQATFFSPEMRARGEGSPFRAMFDKVIGASIQGRHHDREHLIAFFNAHNAAVRAAIPAERLLEFDARQGWAPLCAFLGVPVPETPYPKSNSSEEFVARAEAMAKEREAAGKI